MLKRLELAGRAMITNMAQMETISNNLANINTSGFKKEKLFLQSLNEKLNTLLNNTGTVNTQEPYAATIVDFTQGFLKETKHRLDAAITGEGMFVIEAPQGEVYTRDGRFTLNADKILTTIDGYPVLGEGGQIELDIEQNSASQILINEMGEILIDGNLIDKLKIITLENPQYLNKMGANLYQLSAKNNSPVEAENASVKQGFIEESNVNPVTEMIAMIEINHAFKTSEKAIKTHDQLLGKAVNSIGRV